MAIFSFWDRDLLSRPRELVIIGAGITGLSAACRVAERRPDWSVLVVDKMVHSRAASTRNAGFLCFGSAGEVRADADRDGIDSAIELVLRRWRGLRQLEEALDLRKAGLERCGGYELIPGEKNIGTGELGDWIRTLNGRLREEIGPEVYRMADDRIDAFGFSGVRHLVFNPYEAVIHPAQLVNTLTRLARHRGVRIAEGIEVQNVVSESNGFLLQTKEPDLGLRTERLLYATNGFVSSLLPEVPVRPARNLVLLSEEIPHLAVSGTYHMEEGYIYFRNVGRRLLIGGGRHWDLDTEYTDRPGVNPVIRDRLVDLAQRKILPGMQIPFRYEWSGIMGVPPEGEPKTPIIARLGENEYVAVRLSGMGVALGWEVGGRAAALIDQYG